MAHGDWLILHGGALGDLALTIQLALRLPDVMRSGRLHVVSRTDPGDLSACRPSITRQSSEGLGLHWLFGDQDDLPPERLTELARGKRVLSALGGVHAIVHHRLAELKPAAVLSVDPKPRPGVQRHITEQWRTQLESQGLLVPKCIHQRPRQRGLGVPTALRERGRGYLDGRHGRVGREGHRQSLGPRLSLAGASGSVQQRRDIVLIHPGSGGRGKCWPLRCFVELGRRLMSCFVLGPVELETWPKSELSALAAEFPVLCDPEPDDLAAVLAAARALVGNDAGPTHLAALLGTPTVTIFGPTSPGIWSPLGPVARVLSGDAESHPIDWGISTDRVASLLGASA